MFFLSLCCSSVPLWKVVFAVFFYSSTSNPTIKSISSSINIGISKALNNTLEKYRYTTHRRDTRFRLLYSGEEEFNKKYTCKSLWKLGYHFVACSFFPNIFFFYLVVRTSRSFCVGGAFLLLFVE